MIMQAIFGGLLLGTALWLKRSGGALGSVIIQPIVPVGPPTVGRGGSTSYAWTLDRALPIVRDAYRMAMRELGDPVSQADIDRSIKISRGKILIHHAEGVLPEPSYSEYGQALEENVSDKLRPYGLYVEQENMDASHVYPIHGRWPGR